MAQGVKRVHKVGPAQDDPRRSGEEHKYKPPCPPRPPPLLRKKVRQRFATGTLDIIILANCVIA